MGEESCVVRRVSRGGIEVTVTMSERTFDVCVVVQPEADISRKYQCEDFTFKFWLLNKAKKLEVPVCLERRYVKYHKGSAYNNVRLVFKHEEYKGEISLAPKLYVPDEELAKAERKMKAKKPKQNKAYKNSSPRGGRTKNFNPIPYSNTNIARPYSGGKCTPK